MDGAGSSKNFPFSQIILLAAIKSKSLPEPRIKNKFFKKLKIFAEFLTFSDARGAKTIHLSATLMKQKVKL